MAFLPSKNLQPNTPLVDARPVQFPGTLPVSHPRFWQAAAIGIFLDALICHLKFAFSM
jgi:hypothetical protein